MNALSGKKTYIVAALAVIYLFGGDQAWWTVNTEIMGIFAAAGLATLRAGMTKSAPATTPPAPSALPPSSALPLMLCLLLAIPAITFGTACKNPERATYRVAATTMTTVDAAMHTWGDHVRAGRATAEQEDQVRAAYEHYQSTVRMARIWYQTSATSDRPTLDRLLDTISLAQAELIVLIQRLTRS
jgi:hypothetical protein